MKTTTSWSVTTGIRSSPSRAKHACDCTRLWVEPREHLRPHRAGLHADLRRLRHGQLRARLLRDAGGGDLLRDRDGVALADADGHPAGAGGVRDLGLDR